jgi:ubiquinone/menaquinone biosynthesis C-methylase UbiE
MDNFYDNLERKIFTIILKAINGKKNILDIGCGSCKLVFFLARELKNIRVVGVDLHKWEFPDTVEKRRKEKITNEVQCLKADASDLSFLEDKSFDAVVSVYSLHEFGSPQKALQEAFRVLHKGGKLIIVDFIKGTLADKLWGERYYTPERIKNMPENAGFQNISSQLLSKEGPGIFTGIKREDVGNFNKLVDSYLKGI